jgi:hypothetical protein
MTRDPALDPAGDDRSGAHASLRLLLGAYVLGSLDDRERQQVDTHLRSCGLCADEVAALAGLPSRLRRALSFGASEAGSTSPGGLKPDDSPDRAHGPDGPTPPLDRVVAAARRQVARRRRHQVTGIAATAALVVGVALGAVAVSTEPPGPAGPPATAASRELALYAVGTPGAAGRPHAAGQADVIARPWGSELVVEVRSPVGPGQLQCVVVGPAGPQAAGSWFGVGHATTVTLAVAIRPREVRGVEVVGPSGTVLLASPHASAEATG